MMMTVFAPVQLHMKAEQYQDLFPFSNMFGGHEVANGIVVPISNRPTVHVHRKHCNVDVL